MSARADELREAAIARVRAGAGKTTVEERQAAYDNTLAAAHPAAALCAKVAKNAYKVTDEDVAAVVAAGVSEDQVFELVIAAAMGQASRQLASALAAVDNALAREARAKKESAR